MFFKKGSLLLNHENCNVTKFGQDLTENKKFLSQGQKVVRTPF